MLAARLWPRQKCRMMIRTALFASTFALAGMNAPALAQTDDRDSYAAADLDAIKTMADTIDIAGMRASIEQLRSSAWRGAPPAVPADATVSIDLVVSSSFMGADTSVVLWRDAAGEWQWRRADHDGRHPPDMPPPPPFPIPPDWVQPPYDAYASAYKFDGGKVGSVHAYELDRQLRDIQRRAETWYSPPSTPLKGTDEVNACYDGAVFLAVIRRAGEPDELIAQACQTRWLNGALLNLLDGRFGKP